MNVQENEHTGEELSTFDNLLREAQHGEKLEDPRCGKHEEAVLMDVGTTVGERYTTIEMTWGNMMNTEGQEFTFTDKIFLPDEESHPMSKISFMQKLKALGVVPTTYKDMLYFNSEKAVDRLAADIQEICIGQQYPITITMSDAGFYNTRVRKQPKSKIPF